VVTILVSPEDAERIVMATSQGAVHFALRNNVDRLDSASPPVLLSQLTPLPPQAKAPKAGRPAPKPYTVETFMGPNVKSDNFQ
jgi:pilus assembly protein CpaB